MLSVRVRGILAVSALALVVGPMGAAHAAKRGAAPPVTPGSVYLALGDSVTFGYQETTVVPPPDDKKPSTLMGYPELLRRDFGVRAFNASCPGETSESFIDVKATSFGCESTLGSAIGYRDLFPLHVVYKGSQYAYALSFLRKHPRTRLVSLMIGANDLFVCRATKNGCAAPADQHAVLAKIRGNVRKIVSAIRNKAHYRGQLVIVHYWSLSYASSAVTALSKALNKAQDDGAKGFDVAVADGFGEFRAASAHSGGDPCKAGLLTQLSSGGCGVHPSYAGQALLGLAVERAVDR